MAAEKKKAYGNMRIMAFEGKDLFRAEAITALKNGKLNTDKFGGIMDESLDTDKLCEVYKAHEAEIGYPYLADKKYCRALVSVSFDLAVKQYEQYGRRFVRYGHTVTDADMQDHACVREVDGKLILVAIEIPYEKDRSYAPVEKTLPTELLGKYFVYDGEKKAYQRSKKDIPSAVKCDAIREHLYTHGFDIDGIHYVRYKRSAGSSRDGRCLFIVEQLYAKMMEWSACGLSADTVSDQASWQAYIALTLSSIENTIRLPKKAILIIPDKVSRFTTKAVCVKEDAKEGLTAEEEETEIENVIWDGEALLDVSEFENAGYGDKGMMLLRNRFFKTCAFNTNLQEWFADNGITTVGQLAGYTKARKVEDIKLVITESSLKYLKFMPKDMSLDDAFKSWLKVLYDGVTTSEFGIVKTDKAPHTMFGHMTYTNYQIMNTLNLNRVQMEGVLEESFDYLSKILNDPVYMRHYINVSGTTAEISEDEELSLDTYRRDVVLDMTVKSPLFQYTDFYKSFRTDTVKHFKNRLKKGKIAVTGSYQTIFGNPYEFLCAIIDKDYEPTEPLLLGNNEVHSIRFPNDQVMLCARSPHITMGNLFAVRNRIMGELLEYFNLSGNIICINSIGDNIQQRLNGCDYDSDAMLVTNNGRLLAQGLADIYHSLGVPVCKIAPSGKAEYSSSAVDLAKLDRAIGENKIGEIVNLSQFLNSVHWNSFFNADITTPEKHEAKKAELYGLYFDICKLAVLSGMEIDKAKRLYPVDANKVLRLLSKRKRDFKKAHGDKLPDFYYAMIGNEDKMHGDSAVKLDCPMSFIYDIVNECPVRAKPHATVKLSELFALDANERGENDTHKKQNIIEAVIDAHKKITLLQMQARHADTDGKRIILEKAQKVFADCLSVVSRNIINDHILCMLLKELDNPKDSKYEIRSCRHLLFACILYEKNRRLMSKVITPDDYKPEDLVFISAPLIMYDMFPHDETIYDYPHLRKPCPTEKAIYPFN